MSPQDLEVRNYLQTLEQRVQKLEADAAAQSAPVDETLQPTYLTLTPAGLVSAVFPGGVQMDEQTAVGYNVGSALGWLDSAGGGEIREFIAGEFGGDTHNLFVASQADATDNAYIVMQTAVLGPAGASQILIACEDNSGDYEVIALLNSAGRTGFLMGGALNPPVITDVTASRAIGGGPYTPNANHPTLVIASVTLTTVGNVFASCIFKVSGSGVAQANLNGAAGVNLATVVPITVLVPAGGTYQMVAAGGGVVGLDQVIEYQL